MKIEWKIGFSFHFVFIEKTLRIQWKPYYKHYFSAFCTDIHAEPLSNLNVDCSLKKYLWKFFVSQYQYSCVGMSIFGQSHVAFRIIHYFSSFIFCSLSDQYSFKLFRVQIFVLVKEVLKFSFSHISNSIVRLKKRAKALSLLIYPV